MKRLIYYLSIFLGICSIHSAGCNCKEPYDCVNEGDCGTVYILANLSQTSDTMYVGDTLTLEAQVPEHYWQIKGQDTIKFPINSLKNEIVSYGLYFIDTAENGKVRLPTEKETFVLGGEVNRPFTNEAPYRYKSFFILKEIGVYFLQTSSDNSLIINGHNHPAILEWNVPDKNFELLRPLGDDRVQSAIVSDAGDHYNYFPFEVIEK